MMVGLLFSLLLSGPGLFQAKRCPVCHSYGGSGNTKGALDGVGRKLSPEQIRQWLVDPEKMAVQTGATRKPSMKPPVLTPEELDELVRWLSTLKA